jgi:hypothetical protein
VRDKLESLLAQGTVVADGDGKVRTFRVAADVVEKWSQVLGLAKSNDHSIGKVGEQHDES